MKGFIRNIGISSSVESELWTLRDGLSLYLSFNILAVEIENLREMPRLFSNGLLIVIVLILTSPP